MEALAPEIREEGQSRLEAIEAEEGVRVLHAVESGSRAWGFPSPDSDYDVRFIYVRPVRDYLALKPPRDVVERPIDGLWDVNGWDLGKALKLAVSGNAIVTEWLASPLLYRDGGAVTESLRDLIARHYDVSSAVRAYGGLLRSQYQRDLEGAADVKLKKYFYSLRAAAALNWLRLHRSPPPMRLQHLLQGAPLPADVDVEVTPMLAAKLTSRELGTGARRPTLDRYIVEALRWADSQRERQPPNPEFLRDAEVLYCRALGV